MRFTKKEIKALLGQVGKRLLEQKIQGEIGIVGGAAMVLAYDARIATQDIDAIFKPSDIIRKIVSEIASENDLPEDWLNNGVKDFLPGNPIKKVEVLDLPGLRVWVPEPEYMLAMKAMSARVDSKDADDLKLLIRKLHLKTPSSVFAIVVKYYPHHKIPTKMHFFVEELMGDVESG